MGKDKYENEDLIKYGHPEDVWWHVDDLSSAHVYLRQKSGETLKDISPELLLDCASLVKANSIEGCKKSEVYVVYTRWKNLKKTSDMVDGQVGFYRPDNVRRVSVEKNNAIVKILEKSKREIYPHRNLAKEQQDRLEEIQRLSKEQRRSEEKQKRIAIMEAKMEQEERSYDRIMTAEKMTSNQNVKATVDTSAAEEFEDDFF